MPNTDGNGNDIVQAWTTDPSQLMLLCSIDPSCEGFNSNGWLKQEIASVASPGTDLYLKVG